MPQNIYQAVWIFIIYAFLGWCSEVAFAAVNKGKFVNRGFLNGPVCPIYGVGMLIVVLCLWNLRDRPLLLFLGSALLTTALEFVTGFVLERNFVQRRIFKAFPNLKNGRYKAIFDRISELKLKVTEKGNEKDGV